MPKATDHIGVMLGEATSGSLNDRVTDMVNIASAIQNRALRAGLTPQQVVANQREFNVYGKALPKGAAAFRSVAQAAWDYVSKNGPVHTATYYATPATAKNLPKGLQQVAVSKGHVFFDDPEDRAFGTAVGYVQPAPKSAVPAAMAAARTPGPGLAALAPNGLVSSVADDGMRYTHAGTRGNWKEGLQPDTIRSAQMLNSAFKTPAGSPLSLTSAYRSPSVNAAVGGARHSQHMSGDAYDMDLSRLSDQQKAKAVETARMTGATRIGAYSGDNSIHVDFAPGFENSEASLAFGADVHPMYDRSAKNMANAPGWFTQGLRQTTVPTPTARPSIGDVLSQKSLRQAAPRTMDEAAARNVAKGTSLPPDRAMPAGNMAAANLGSLPPDRQMPSGPLSQTGPVSLPPDRQMPTGPVAPTVGQLAVKSVINQTAPTELTALERAPRYVAPLQPPALMPVQPRIMQPRALSPAPAALSYRAPAPSAYDVYDGRAQSAIANDGSTVSRDQFGNTSLTNKYGATTVTTPDGRQAASYGMFSDSSPSGPISSAPGSFGFDGFGDIGKDLSAKFDRAGQRLAKPFRQENIGNTTRKAVGGILGLALGNLVGSPVLGALAMRAGANLATSGTFSGMRTFESPVFGNIRAAAAQQGFGFPTAPAAPTAAQIAGVGGNRPSGLSAAERASLSPAASRSISRGGGGLY